MLPMWAKRLQSILNTIFIVALQAILNILFIAAVFYGLYYFNLFLPAIIACIFWAIILLTRVIEFQRVILTRLELFNQKETIDGDK